MAATSSSEGGCSSSSAASSSTPYSSPNVPPFHGECYCGAVRLCVREPAPLRSLYCHCKECRRFHAAPLYSTFLLYKDDVTVVYGDEHITYFLQDKMLSGADARINLQRAFCSKCGTRLFNELNLPTAVLKGQLPRLDESKPITQLRASFQSVFFMQESEMPKAYQPTEHVWCSEAIIPLANLSADGLPKNSKSARCPDNILL
eukprot:CAMPEP_0174237700 /NCGR_PEP_ID=MMETSP0417-20130205/9207_1 /TAXON_ID=242541 /ORGANISM="Mayorella sp, Strain BSH-02190019" /LENGTH=202 /DNA_ID=CAMNT_0015316485 /DNA_START=9 /DNA_END=617 /DNA_ORIENTATION=+